MWLGVWGLVPHGHLSECEMFSLWRWVRSWQCPVLSLKIVTWAALSSWWMLFYSAQMPRRCCHCTLSWSCFLGWSFLRCRTLGVQIAPICFPFLTAGLPPLCLKHHSEKGSTEGHRCFVLRQRQLQSDVAEDLVHSWRSKTLQSGPAVSQKHCVGRNSLFLVQGLGCCEQGTGFSSAAGWLLPL